MDASFNEKIIILSVFDNMGIPMTEDTISTIVTEQGWVSLMNFVTTFKALKKNNLIVKLPKFKNPTFVLTDDGKKCLVSFFDKLPNYTKKEIHDVIHSKRLEYRKHQEYKADYTKNTDGSYNVTLKINGEDNNPLEVKLIVSNRQQAKWIYEQWQQKASSTYELLFDHLLD